MTVTLNEQTLTRQFYLPLLSEYDTQLQLYVKITLGYITDVLPGVILASMQSQSRPQGFLHL